MKDKSIKLNMELNSMNRDLEDPTILRATWLLHDFNQNANNVLLDREVSLDAKHTIKNKPIVTSYNEVNEFDTPTDALGDHAEYIGTDKKGNPIQKSDTVPIGTITSEAYIMTIENSDGVTEEVMACDSVLWLSRFQDACNLLIEWYERGIQIVSSCEYYYKNFTLQDGITHVHSPVYYDGHCILNSEDRGGHKKVQPAYDKSVMLSLNELQEFNKLVSQAIVEEESEEKDSMAKKTVKEVNETIAKDEEVLETESVTKEVSEDENKEEKPSKSVEELEAIIEKLEAKIEELEAEIVELKDGKAENNSLSEKLEEATNKAIELNNEIKELNSYKEKYNNEVYEKALSEKMEYYKSKFKALNSMIAFEEDEVQALVEKSVSENDEGRDAIMSLNSMLLDLVVTDSLGNDKGVIKETCSAEKTLINTNTSFDSKYK